jgi:hypothetical protein
LYPGGHAAVLSRLLVAETIAAGQLLQRTAALDEPQEAELPTTTVLTGALGIAAEDVVPADADGMAVDFAQRDLNTVACIVDPYSVYGLPVSGSNVSGAAFVESAAATPASILVNETLDATGLLVEDDAVGVIDQSGGLLIALTGLNANEIRKITAHVDNTSVAVEQKFPHPLAVGDEFLRLPLSRVAQLLTLTDGLDEVNGIAEYGVGADLRVVGVKINTVARQATVYAVAGDHHLNATL